MKVACAQIYLSEDDIQKNIERHLKFIELAVSKNVDLLIFPELSLTSYQKTSAQRNTFSKSDKRLDLIENLSINHSMVIGVGAPLKTQDLPNIGMIYFSNGQRLSYAKQFLHDDEKAFFSNGNAQLTIKLENEVLAPAICYESSVKEHSDQVGLLNGTIYMVSVADASRHIAATHKNLKALSEYHQMTVLLSNAIGPCEEFECFGNSAIWDDKGNCLSKFGHQEEGILIYDTDGKVVNNVLL